ncbi:hypothetical protein FOA43_000795 [Brettanomyces nanus]|uniref:Carbohydrate kinase PfkB domain-containing protein n=1 Tax=Eeniella nana TaxID=13502 RepID=A0A875S2A2_EENNA|nr:uncharacterized protein FOA43_000795 [Brettanomyces nanus]QPG73484.1 hypothetical protein FOA43_000795 [Brettanomyces nanus]
MPKIEVSDEIRQAVRERRPVLALESTIITHGLPYPANIEMAANVEQIIRNHNVVPATVAFVRGVPKVGLSKEDLEQVADNTYPRYKISRRDIPYVMSEKLTGGTTIAATMILAYKAGVDVFATGGLGGVSRPYELMDVSADLDELSKTPVSVVCSGPKSILDVGRTIEYLETKGVPVFTYDDGRFPGGTQRSLNIPGFYTRDSGIASPFMFNDFHTAANVIFNGKYSMQLNNGYVFCIPAPVDIALSSDYINGAIQDSLLDAQKLNVRGKSLTPFLLEKINQLTHGESVKCNIAFVKNNATIGSQIACELAKLKQENEPEKSSLTPVQLPGPVITASSSSAASDASPPTFNRSAVIGSLSLDSTSIIRSQNSLKMGDSNPGSTTHSVGGVGFNVALTSTASSRMGATLFITALNLSDSAGKYVMETMEKYGLPKQGLCSLDDKKTAQYTSIHDASGKLIVACADMDIVECLPKDYVIELLAKYKPSCVLMDSNISIELMNDVLKYTYENGIKLFYEPTSAVKAYKLGKANVHCFPDHEVNLMTPTVAELGAIFESFSANGKFEDLDSWFPILDMLCLDKLRQQLEVASRKLPFLDRYSEDGVFQQAFNILPYVPNILIKDGPRGILLIQLIDNASEAVKLMDQYSFNFKAPSQTEASMTLVQEGSPMSHNLGVIVQHFPGYKVASENIKSVTGAGDSMVGYILAKLSENQNLSLKDLANPEREKIIMNSQKVACFSLASSTAVNFEEIQHLDE